MGMLIYLYSVYSLVCLVRSCRNLHLPVLPAPLAELSSRLFDTHQTKHTSLRALNSSCSLRWRSSSSSHLDKEANTLAAQP
jgi:hypothetical protein